MVNRKDLSMSPFVPFFGRYSRCYSSNCRISESKNAPISALRQNPSERLQKRDQRRFVDLD